MSIGDCKMQIELGRVRCHFVFFNTQFAIVFALHCDAPAQGSPGGESPFRQKGPTLTSICDDTPQTGDHSKSSAGNSLRKSRAGVAEVQSTRN